MGSFQDLVLDEVLDINLCNMVMMFKAHCCLHECDNKQSDVCISCVRLLAETHTSLYFKVIESQVTSVVTSRALTSVTKFIAALEFSRQ